MFDLASAVQKVLTKGVSNKTPRSTGADVSHHSQNSRQALSLSGLTTYMLGPTASVRAELGFATVVELRVRELTTPLTTTAGTPCKIVIRPEQWKNHVYLPGKSKIVL